MRSLHLALVISLIVLAAACGEESKADTPIETFKTYITAIKQKDTTRMKLLLSSESIKMHEQEPRPRTSHSMTSSNARPCSPKVKK